MFRQYYKDMITTGRCKACVENEALLFLLTQSIIEVYCKVQQYREY